VDDRSNGAGRLVWGAVATATSYDIEITLGTENTAQGTTGEDTHNLNGVGCCAQSFSVNSGWRITAVGYRVRAVNAAGAGPWSPELLQAINYPTPAPGRPTGVDYDRGTARILWRAVSGATAYDVEWRQPGETTQGRVALCSTSDDTLLGRNCALRITRILHKELTFRVRAKNQGGTQFGPWSSWESDAAETQAPVQAPGAVSGLRYQSGRIRWDTAARATAYDIEWRNAGGASTLQSVTCSSSCSLGITRAPDKELQFRVRAKNGGGTGPWSAWATEAAEVDVPGAVSGLDYRSGRIVWQAVSGASAYDVEWRHRGEQTTAQRVTCSSSCFLAVQAEAGKQLQFRVRAISQGGSGTWTAWHAYTKQTQAPSAPRNMRAVATGERHLRASWAAPSDSGSSAISHYLVQYSRPAIGTGQPWKSEVFTTTSTSHTKYWLRFATTYTVTVTAVNRDGQTSPAATARGTTNAEAAAPPSAPRNVRAVATGERNLRASWSAPSSTGGSAISHYLVQYSRPKIGNSPKWGSEVFTTTGTSHIKYWLRYGTTYTVTVWAVNEAGKKSPAATARGTTNTQQAKAPSSPRNVRATAAGERNLWALWSAPSSTGGSAISHYLVQYSRPKIGTIPKWESEVYTTKGTSHITYRLRYGTTYTVTVWAVNEAGKKSPAATGRGTTNTQQEAAPPSKPRNVDYVPGELLVQQRFTYSEDTISWDRVPNATRYRLRFQYPKMSVKYHDIETDCGRVRCETVFLRNPGHDWLKYSIQAVRGDIRGGWSGWQTWYSSEVGLQCPPVSKYLRVDGRAKSRTTFRTITGDTIRAGDVGGKIDSVNNLGHRGCAWIFEDVEVKGSAEVLGNAVVGHATIKDTAEVYGNAVINVDDPQCERLCTTTIQGNAKVYGDVTLWGEFTIEGGVRIYGNATLEGPEHLKIRGRAHIRGNAYIRGKVDILDDVIIEGNATIIGNDIKIGGDIRVANDAIVIEATNLDCHDTSRHSGNAKSVVSEVAEKCRYDGHTEYQRAAEDYLPLLVAEQYEVFLKCDTSGANLQTKMDRARKRVKEHMVQKGLAISILKDVQCSQLKGIKEIMDGFTPSPIELALGFGLPIAKGASLPITLARVLDVVSTGSDIRNLITAGSKISDVRESIDEARNDEDRISIAREVYASRFANALQAELDALKDTKIDDILNEYESNR